jgi:acyl-homoserine lactone synthase
MMAKLHVICEENRHLYREVLEDYWGIRHDIYVGERRWMDLERPDGREIDQFDTPSTIYLMALEDRRVVGSHRLVPTTEPTLMSELFPHLSLKGIIRSPDICELSREFVVKERRGGNSFPRIESIVMAGTMEYGLLEGLRQFTVVMETWWLPRFQQMGWNPRPLGLPVDIDGLSCVGVTVDVTEAAWRETCRVLLVDRTVLEWNGVAPPLLSAQKRIARAG